MDHKKARQNLTKTCMRCGVEMPYDEDCACLVEQDHRSREKRNKFRSQDRRQARREKIDSRLWD